jgi:hypothetical protein
MVKTKCGFKELKPMYKILAIVVLLSSLGISFGQDLERARELVETAREQMVPSRLQTVEVKVTQKNLQTGESNTIEQFFDLRNEQVFSMAFTGDGQVNNKLTFSNGELKTNLDGRNVESLGNVVQSGMEFSLSMGRFFTRQLTDFQVLLPTQYEVISYDGDVTYGDTLKGEQITLSFQDTRRDGDTVTRSFIFSKEGFVVGTFQTGRNTFLTSYEVFGFGDYLRVTSISYAVTDGYLQPLGEVREDYQFNKSIDRTSFATW